MAGSRNSGETEMLSPISLSPPTTACFLADAEMITCHTRRRSLESITQALQPFFRTTSSSCFPFISRVECGLNRGSCFLSRRDVRDRDGVGAGKEEEGIRELRVKHVQAHESRRTMTTTEGERKAGLALHPSIHGNSGWKRGCPEIDVYPDKRDESGEKSARKGEKRVASKEGHEMVGRGCEEDNECEFFHPLFCRTRDLIHVLHQNQESCLRHASRKRGCPHLR